MYLPYVIGSVRFEVFRANLKYGSEHLLLSIVISLE